MKRKQGYMSFDLFKKIVDEIGEHKIIRVWLHLFGEPLLHPELGKFIQYIKSKKKIKEVTISTNSIFLDEKKARIIIGSGLDTIRMCLDGITKETYEKIRLRSDFERVRNNILAFLELRNKMNSETPKVELQIIHMQNTREEVEKFKKIWKPLLRKDDVLHVQKYVNFGGEVADLTITKKNLLNKMPCLRLWNTLSICWDGVAVACCYDSDWKLKVGDVNKQTIKDIWKGKAMNNLRKLHLKREIDKIPLCKDCIRQVL